MHIEIKFYLCANMFWHIDNCGLGIILLQGFSDVFKGHIGSRAIKGQSSV